MPCGSSRRPPAPSPRPSTEGVAHCQHRRLIDTNPCTTAAPARAAPGGLGPYAATLVLVAVALALPLMMGNRNPLTLTASQLVMVSGALLAGLLATLPLRGALPPPSRVWMAFFAVFTGYVLLQVLPLPALAQAFGPYPEALWNYADFEARHWSPDIGASLRGWAAFVALFTIAWIARRMRSAQRNLVWLALVAMALFQAVYGVTAQAAGADSIFGIWSRNNPDFVHGTFSNYNLFAAYLALLWPLAIAVWWIREMPLLGRLPRELKLAGSLITGAVIGAALFASTSRLGSAERWWACSSGCCSGRGTATYCAALGLACRMRSLVVALLAAAGTD
jgi:putative inorganic carbon (hco3(-)) transporter